MGGTFWLGSFTYQCSENPTTIIESRYMLAVGLKIRAFNHFHLNTVVRRAGLVPALTLQKPISEHLTPPLGAQ